MHGTRATQDFTIMASDAVRPDGALTVGNQVRVSLQFDNEAEIETVFARLGDGGRVIDLLTEMF